MRKRLLAAFCGAMSIALIGGALHQAQAQASPAFHKGCVNKKSKQLRVVSSKASCKRTETTIQIAGKTAVGPSGAAGPTGAQGPAGTAGVPGVAGPQGSAGTSNEAGPVGPAGPKGDTGVQGERGATGAAGAAGAAGAVGLTGPQGERGATGAAGAAGAVGLTGPQGERGATGLTGTAGSVGPAGAKGDTGLQGERGATGAAGAAGAAGAVGAQGTKGPDGERGEIGLTGPAGPQGDTGSPGPKGDTGAQGERGAAGLNGITNARTATIASGQPIGPDGIFLGTLTLDRSKNYLVSSGVTAYNSVNGAMQCQLISNNKIDDFAEVNIASRASVSTEHLYAASGVGNVVVYLGCLTAGTTYQLETAHLNAIEVSTINASGHVIFGKSAAPQLSMQ